jgi:hypothetical protein
VRPVERIPRTCERCGKAFGALQSHINRGRGRFCSGGCSMAVTRAARWEKHRAEFDSRFWSWVDQSAGPEACWPWLGKHQTRGYGRYRLGGRSHFAHRKALALVAGDPPSAGLLALHSCDNPPCCNPAHLRWGTPADNQADRRQRGRDRSGRAKIDPVDLMRLRGEGLSYSELAAHFGVDQANIGKALKREEKRALLKALIALPDPPVGA